VIANICDCCGEDDGGKSEYDFTLGNICEDCGKGARDGVDILMTHGVSEVYYGPCGDTGKESA